MENNEQVTNQSNGVGIAGFILAFFLPLIGLILSIVGVSKSKTLGTGKGLSIAGIIISVLNIVSRLLIILLFILFSFNAVKSVDFKNVEESVKCVTSYGCKEIDNDNYECKYDSNLGKKGQTITCNKKYIHEFNMRVSNNVIDNSDVVENNDTELSSCDNYTGTGKCVFFKEGNIEIERETKNAFEYLYYINNNKIDVGYIEKGDIKVLESDFVLINYSPLDSLYQLYDKNGSIPMDFTKLNSLGYVNNVIYENKELTVSSMKGLPDEGENTGKDVCDKDEYNKNDVVYIKQRIVYNNENFELLETIETKTLREYIKENYNIDC